MSILKKCKISRYDSSIKEPPYLTIQIDSIEVMQPEKDHLGEQFYKILVNECHNMGYRFKFYTLSCDDKNFDYNIIVY